MLDLRRRLDALEKEIAARDVTEHELRAALAAKTPKAWRTWIGQLPAILTALAAVGALFYTAQGLAQSQAATSKQNELALQQNQLAQSGQITDRFNAAVTNLGSQVITIRIGGIYALQRIMTDSPSDQRAATQVLAAFVRGQSPPAAPVTATPALDVQAALTTLTHSRPNQGPTITVDLHGAYLASADLAGADLTHADLIGTHLADADLSGANLTGADLTDADLTDANLNQADLNGADLYRTSLRKANLTFANMAAENVGTVGAGGFFKGADLFGTSMCDSMRPTHDYGYDCQPLLSVK